MKKKIFEFFTKNEFLNEDITPVRTVIPEWYKKTKKVLFEPPNAEIVKGLKSCTPFLDAMTTGYVLKTSQDIRVTFNVNGDGIYYFQWNEANSGIEIKVRDGVNPIPTPLGYIDSHFIWDVPFCIRVPKGYSVLITHPLNRTDLPFISLSGIVDADEGLTGGSYPFFLKKGFEGIIPVGTPILQYIPFKRDDWKSKWEPSLELVAKKHRWNSRKFITGWYKNNIWKKKNYE